MADTETKPGAEPQAAEGSPAPQAGKPGAGEYQSEGRYIPYSGGSLGWFENSGVLTVEKRNNYLFHTVMDPAMVRAKQIQRSGVHAEKRRSARHEQGADLSATVLVAKEQKTLRVLDLSLHGAKLQFTGAAIALHETEKAVFRFHDAPGGAPLLELPCTIARVEQMVGRMRTLWIIGIAFQRLAPEQTKTLRRIGKLDEPPAGGTEA
ncbi:MAG: PilZ domain-containing protein [SAR324 cluster bacterium]